MTLTAADAQGITDRIRRWVKEFPLEDVQRAYEGRIWLAMEYQSWAEWCDKELDGFRLPTADRRQIVSRLVRSGLSQRAIAEVLDVDRKTVRRDQVGEMGPPAEVLGQDGKTYRPKNTIADRARRWAEQERAKAEKTADENATVVPPADVIQVDDWADGSRFVCSSNNRDPVLGDITVGGYQKLDGHVDWWLDVNDRELYETSPDLIRNAANALLAAADDLERRQASDERSKQK